MAAIALVAPVLSACGGGYSDEESIEITQTIESPEIDLSISGRERFGRAQPAAADGEAPGGPQESPLAWDVPEHWMPLPISAMRLANFAIGPQQAAECYVTVLGGTGGGVAANINRWRTQMNQPEMTEAEIQELPTIPLLNREAVYIEIDGAYQGMGDTVQEDDAKMLGAVLVAGSRAVFVKMVGPTEVVEPEIPAFKTFVESLRPRDAPAPSAEAPATSASEPGVSWTAPDSWERESDRAMRLVTFSAPDDVECYASVLAGAAGGLEANINRWLGEMGQAPMEPEAIADMPTIPMLGQDAPLLQAEGAYTGMSGETLEDAGMLAVVCELADQTLFVKMTGPRDAVSAQRDNFIAFCESFEM